MVISCCLLSLFPTPEDVMMLLKSLLCWFNGNLGKDLISDVSCFHADSWSLTQGPGRDWLGGLPHKKAYRNLNTPKGEVGIGLMMSALRTSQPWSLIPISILVSHYVTWIFMTLLESPHGACQRPIDRVGGTLRRERRILKNLFLRKDYIFMHHNIYFLNNKIPCHPCYCSIGIFNTFTDITVPWQIKIS